MAALTGERRQLQAKLAAAELDATRAQEQCARLDGEAKAVRRSHEQLQARLNETSRAKLDADAELARRQQAIERAQRGTALLVETVEAIHQRVGEQLLRPAQAAAKLLAEAARPPPPGGAE